MEITKEKYEYAQPRIDALLLQVKENMPLDNRTDDGTHDCHRRC